MCHNTIQGRLSFRVLQPYRVDAFGSPQSTPALHALTLVSAFLAASAVERRAGSPIDLRQAGNPDESSRVLL